MSGLDGMAFPEQCGGHAGEKPRKSKNGARRPPKNYNFDDFSYLVPEGQDKKGLGSMAFPEACGGHKKKKKPKHRQP